MPTLRLNAYTDAPFTRVFDFALVGVGPECYVRGVSMYVFDRVSLFALLKWLVRLSFEDEMGSGAFKSMHHRHEFVSKSVATEMTDAFRFTAALGILDRTANFHFHGRTYIGFWYRVHWD